MIQSVSQMKEDFPRVFRWALCGAEVVPHRLRVKRVKGRRYLVPVTCRVVVKAIEGAAVAQEVVVEDRDAWRLAESHEQGVVEVVPGLVEVQPEDPRQHRVYRAGYDNECVNFARCKVGQILIHTRDAL